jgi:hypothetical protein
MENETTINHQTPPDAKRMLAAVASIDEIEEVAKQYFENKYPLMDLSNDEDKCEIDWWDMLQFVQHVLSKTAVSCSVVHCWSLNIATNI